MELDRHAGQEPKINAATLWFQREETGVLEANHLCVLCRRLCLLVFPLVARLHPCSTPCDGDGAWPARMRSSTARNTNAPVPSRRQADGKSALLSAIQMHLAELWHEEYLSHA